MSTFSSLPSPTPTPTPTPSPHTPICRRATVRCLVLSFFLSFLHSISPCPPPGSRRHHGSNAGLAATRGHRAAQGRPSSRPGSSRGHAARARRPRVAPVAVPARAPAVARGPAAPAHPPSNRSLHHGEQHPCPYPHLAAEAHGPLRPYPHLLPSLPGDQTMGG